MWGMLLVEMFGGLGIERRAVVVGVPEEWSSRDGRICCLLTLPPRSVAENPIGEHPLAPPFRHPLGRPLRPAHHNPVISPRYVRSRVHIVPVVCATVVKHHYQP